MSHEVAITNLTMKSPTSQQSPFRPRILLVDDNPAIHQDFLKILAQNRHERDALFTQDEKIIFGDSHPEHSFKDFEVDSAYQGQEAMAMLERSIQENRPYALAFVDIRMPPGWDGLETIVHLWRVCPDLQIVICTAYSDFSWNDINLRFGHSDKLLILKKPFDNIEVLQLAHTLSEKWLLTNQVKKQLADLDHLVSIRTAELQNVNEQLKFQMDNQKRLEEQVRQKHKVEAVGRLSAGIAHEFNNILMIITGFVDVLRADLRFDRETKELLNGIKDASTRASRLVQQLLAFGGKQFLRPQALHIRDILKSLSSILNRTLEDKVKLIFNEAPDAPMIWGDPGLLSQVIMNLVLNACDAMPNGGKIIIETRLTEITDNTRHPEIRSGRFLLLKFQDTGIGIKPEDLSHIFEPFFTTKEMGKRVGMGLAETLGIVKQHAGWIDVQSSPGQGTIFHLYFPALTTPQETVSKSIVDKPVLPSPVVKTQHTILVVDDEPMLRKMIRFLLKKEEYNLIEAGSAEEAITIWPKIRDTVDLLLTDMVMPGMHGGELAKFLLQDKPELKIIYCTGFSPELLGGDVSLREGDFYLQKPNLGSDLHKLVRQCLNQSPV